MSGRYAADTKVSSESSRAEIERTLVRYGASAFAYGWDHDEARARIQFRIVGRFVRMTLPLPDYNDFWKTPERGLTRSEAAQKAAYEQAVRQRWRALALVVKAKLEAVDAGISTIEREFLADVLLPDGTTLGEWSAPALEAAYASGRMPTNILALPAPR